MKKYLVSIIASFLLGLLLSDPALAQNNRSRDATCTVNGGTNNGVIALLCPEGIRLVSTPEHLGSIPQADGTFLHEFRFWVPEPVGFRTMICGSEVLDFFMLGTSIPITLRDDGGQGQRCVTKQFSAVGTTLSLFVKTRTRGLNFEVQTVIIHVSVPQPPSVAAGAATVVPPIIFIPPPPPPPLVPPPVAPPPPPI